MVQCSTDLEPVTVTNVRVKVHEHFVDYAVQLPPIKSRLQVGEGVLTCVNASAESLAPHLLDHPAKVLRQQGQRRVSVDRMASHCEIPAVFVQLNASLFFGATAVKVCLCENL